ncbi:hypothetical protein EZV73_20500 [Acidaminobacter sp. JC074]|uniref:acetoacetate decarboxylase family protein n=1 Tax=Acidaminobacter sp. JC074 TaxID=2530199 RepID=UPI001F0EBC13|nr:acetoacetate decarboxylase family protein [Acidaminobacter sp. JC074]MCH4889972.1 hypothetical protein [Acidaminobacter sp. JC074]
MIRKYIGTLTLLGLITMVNFGCIAELDVNEYTDQLGKQDNLQVNEQEYTEAERVINQEKDVEITDREKSKPYRYNENDGIFLFYKTEDEELYRKLLPKEFDMPDEMIVHLFIVDFYDLDSDADPYKEMSISLLAKHNDENIWHCIYMPVTSEQSMMAGILGLGLPKTIGNIEFERAEFIFTGTIVDDQNRSGEISLDTKGDDLSVAEVEIVRNFMSYPKINILKGEFIEMTRAGGAVNIIDVAERYSEFVTIKGGAATITFESSTDTKAHPFDLVPSEIVAAYYMHNKIPFSLDRK